MCRNECQTTTPPTGKQQSSSCAIPPSTVVPNLSPSSGQLSTYNIIRKLAASTSGISCSVDARLVLDGLHKVEAKEVNPIKG